MANTVPILSLSSTFGDWFISTNALAQENNDLVANNYSKSTGTLFLNDPTLGLQVGTNAIIQNNLLVNSANVLSNIQVGGDLYVTGKIIGGEESSFSNTITLTSNTQVSIDSFDATQYRSAKYITQMTSDTSYHIIELLVLHDGANVSMAQYGEITTSSSLGTFDSSITSGTLNLLFTPSNQNTTINLVRTNIKI
jgi:hypothetical protein